MSLLMTSVSAVLCVKSLPVLSVPVVPLREVPAGAIGIGRPVLEAAAGAIGLRVLERGAGYVGLPPRDAAAGAGCVGLLRVKPLRVLSLSVVACGKPLLELFGLDR
ncbi:hypothetical protein PF005_g12535 [Phytophthora fragariae]|uniref:Secreted protein n=1 Tax=Phytophthora fragariae TaxID=53985 RepID=A0A6A3ERY9_9STRA|nr:hypothetical protein PF003_g10843 [Phytophthora fragariae]KAE8936234.1 hypothetical protein PF009_g13830 [Phytophthora fragariae]KAE9000350.1 hypothetical protein PF011_g14219 [Phytophthora fragariae]KAE9094636.1 hypothetical protein PF007_g17696 [Phytophthora fragariae]KAE9094873.1 hypothetical protein PF010_g16922 [Phytophthora fragariae]